MEKHFLNANIFDTITITMDVVLYMSLWKGTRTLSRAILRIQEVQHHQGAYLGQSIQEWTN